MTISDSPRNGDLDGRIIRRRWFAQVPDALTMDLRVSAFALRVYMRLDRYAGSDGGAFPSTARLAADFEVSVSTVKRALAELVATQWIIRKRRGFTNIVDTVMLDQAGNVAGVERLLSEPVRDDTNLQVTTERSNLHDANLQVTTEVSNLTRPEVSNLTRPNKETSMKDIGGSRTYGRDAREACARAQTPPDQIHDQNVNGGGGRSWEPAESPLAPEQRYADPRPRHRPVEATVPAMGQIDGQGLPVVVPDRCGDHVGWVEDVPCRKCRQARIDHDKSMSLRASAIARRDHLAERARDAEARRIADEARLAGRRGAGSLRDMVRARQAERGVTPGGPEPRTASSGLQ
jgi:DNA-binding transcriptional regulator YhcF (GntR family)